MLSLNVDAQTFHKCDVNGKINYQYEPCSDGAGQAVEIHKESDQKIAEREQRLAKEREEKLQLILAKQKAEEKAEEKSNAIKNSPEYQKLLKESRGNASAASAAEEENFQMNSRAWQKDLSERTKELTRW